MTEQIDDKIKLTPEGAQAEVLRQVNIWMEKVNRLFRICLPIPRVRFNLRGKVAATASGWSRLEFNMGFLMQESAYEDMINDTVPHEIAHLVDEWIYKGRGHGRTWKTVMQKMGCQPVRCHNYDLKGVLTGGCFVYKSVCCGHTWQFSKRMHNSIQGGKYRICNRCGRRGRIMFTGTIE